MSERDMQALIALIEKRIGVSWAEISEWLRGQNGIDEIEARLVSGDLNNVITDLQEAALRFAAETHAAYVDAGEAAAKWLDGQLPDSLVRFDVTNRRAVARAQQNQLEIVTGLTQEQRASVNQVLVDGVRSGTNPREMARDIRDSIGLAPDQERAVRSYRRALESGDYTNALGRELSSGHSDRTIVAARASGKALTAEQIDTAVSRYRENYIDHRATVIARTEALRNVHEGVEDSFRQAIERGDVDADQLVREWNAGPATRYARPDHQALSGTRVRYGDDFVTRGGVHLRYPGDPNAPVAETAQCRCAVSTRMV